MCHENFFLQFGPHVTFINGTNGSGKSAILQGLQFCLGMQAAKTGRAGGFELTSDPVRSPSVHGLSCATVARRLAWQPPVEQYCCSGVPETHLLPSVCCLCPFDQPVVLGSKPSFILLPTACIRLSAWYARMQPPQST